MPETKPVNWPAVLFYFLFAVFWAIIAIHNYRLGNYFLMVFPMYQAGSDFGNLTGYMYGKTGWTGLHLPSRKAYAYIGWTLVGLSGIWGCMLGRWGWGVFYTLLGSLMLVCAGVYHTSLDSAKEETPDDSLTENS